MSASNDRWRRQSPHGNQQRFSQALSRDRSIGGSGHITPTGKPDSDRPGMSSFSGNAWGNQKGRNQAQGQSGSQRASAPPGAFRGGLQEEHTPVNGFNSKEAKYTLRKWYQESQMGNDGKQLLYKPQGDVAPRVAGPWGSKPNTMANGQDFWVQVRKQIAALESNKTA